MGELHITMETVGFVITTVAIIAPAFYMVGRFNQRLTSVEKQIELLLKETLLLAGRIADSLDSLVEATRAADEHRREDQRRKGGV